MAEFERGGFTEGNEDNGAVEPLTPALSPSERERENPRQLFPKRNKESDGGAVHWGGRAGGCIL